MKKNIPLYISALLLSIAAQAAPSKTADPQPAPQPAWDADLFRKDAQCISGHVSFLYWTVDERAVDYAIQMQNSAWGDNTSTSYAQGNIQNASYSWDPGFRLALSYFRAPKQWEVWGQYTRMTSHGSNSVGKPSEDTVYLTGTWPQILTQALSGAHSYIHMNYNVVDVLADRYFHPNEHLRLRLLGGAVVAWIDQNWVVKYTDSTPHTTKITNFWRFIGGGIRGGFMGDWFWTSDIYMTGGVTTAVAIGTYENKSKIQTNFAPNNGLDTNTPVQNTHYSDVHPVFNMQVLLGPSWQKSYTNNRFEVFAGYEINLWGNLQEIVRSTGGSPSQSKQLWLNTGLIALQGLTTRLTVDF
jgi:hypothetical protein